MTFQRSEFYVFLYRRIALVWSKGIIFFGLSVLWKRVYVS